MMAKFTPRNYHLFERIYDNTEKPTSPLNSSSVCHRGLGIFVLIARPENNFECSYFRCDYAPLRVFFSYRGISNPYQLLAPKGQLEATLEKSKDPHQLAKAVGFLVTQNAQNRNLQSFAEWSRLAHNLPTAGRFYKLKADEIIAQWGRQEVCNPMDRPLKKEGGQASRTILSTCRHCDRTVTATDVFCDACGEEMGTYNTDPLEGAMYELFPCFCSHCSTLVRRNAVFCPRCGDKFIDEVNGE